MPAVPEGASQVALLHHISSIVSSDLSLEKMLQELISLTLETTRCDACLVYLVDHCHERGGAAGFATAARIGNRQHSPEDGRRHHRLGGAA